MPLSIKHHEADLLARRLAQLTGRSLTDAVLYALKEQLRREQGKSEVVGLQERLMAIGRHCSELPDLDTRSVDDLLGYNDIGAWS